MDTFYLQIDLYNGITAPADVAEVLRQTADRLGTRDAWPIASGEFPVRNANGKHVGEWHVTGE